MSYFADEAQLGAEVAAFVAEGLQRGEPAIVLTCPAHRAGIAEELRRRAIDLEAAVREGDLLLMDAEEMLATLMNGGDMPDAAIYHRDVGAAVASLLRGRPGPVRIFGDMVDLLWRRGQHDAAIRIEMLSNQLAVLHPVTVICGYSMGHFIKRTEKLERVEQLHGRLHQGGAVGRGAVAHDRRPTPQRS